MINSKSNKSNRKDFSCAVKIDTLINQNFCCNNKTCHKGFTKTVRPHFDHISGRSDNKITNCQALCPNCHEIKSVDENRIETERLRKEREISE